MKFHFLLPLCLAVNSLGASFLDLCHDASDRFGITLVKKKQSFSTDVTYLFLNASNDSIVEENLDFNWDSGFRLAMSTEFPASSWLSSFRWTHFNTGNASDVANSSLNFNSFDLEMAKVFRANKAFSIIPTFGLRFLGLNHAYLEDSIALKFHNRFMGLGLKARVDSCIEFGNDFSLYGGAGGSILGGHFATLQQYADQKNNRALWDTITSFDYQFGLRWAKSISTGWISLQLGWESHLLFNQNKYTSVDLQTATKTPFCLHGFILGLSLSL